MSIPRDPARIDRVAELLREAWQLQPDFRLTQLVMVVSDKPEDAGALWHVEDDTMEQKLRAFVAGCKRRQERRTNGLSQ
jgi:uncharacterized protein YihD (DUF1040 family)